ncbi:MAG: DNRLRE domain-containing protein [Phycisphaerales bacterium]|nr:DNRLRE domain-containing protein [Phycisphaerales bacterium]
MFPTGAVCGAAMCLAAAALADQIVLEPVRDNTLIEETTGALSNGQGVNVFAGRVGPGSGATKRRALLAFDLGAIPPGATIESVTLELTVTQAQPAVFTMPLHRVLAAWGEGASEGMGGGGAPAEPGDATWLHRFHPDVFWTTEGGDFAPDASATAAVGGSGTYAWDSTPELVADVQGWLDDASSNHGWVLLGNEAMAQTTKAFTSREWLKARERPRLTVEYAAPTLVGDLNGSGTVDAADLAILLAAWGPCGRCSADLDADGTVGPSDLALLLAQWT